MKLSGTEAYHFDAAKVNLKVAIAYLKRTRQSIEGKRILGQRRKPSCEYALNDLLILKSSIDLAHDQLIEIKHSKQFNKEYKQFMGVYNRLNREYKEIKSKFKKLCIIK